MHADFGCFAEAISAIRETIATARENKDMECLNYSVIWLLNLVHIHPESVSENIHQNFGGAEKETLVFLKSKAKEMHMWSLLSACLLSNAGLLVSHVSTLLPREIFSFPLLIVF